MGRPPDKIVLNDAPSQSGRWLEALDDGYAPVDGRGLSDLLSFPAQFGRLVNFYDLSDAVDGDWQGFFEGDPTMILAALAALDLPRVESAFLALEQRTRAAKGDGKFDLLVELFAAAVAPARDLNGWLAALGPDPSRATARLLVRQIVAAIEGELGAEVRRLIAYAEGAGLPEALGRPVPLDVADLLPIWSSRCDCPDPSIWRGRSLGRKIDHGCPSIAAVFVACLDALLRLQSFARDHLAASLAEADHPPHIALYVAFARLFGAAQATINTVSARYVDFYYRDVLRGAPRAAVPDHVYLTLTLDGEQADRATVPRGTLFSAGADRDGVDLLYAADSSLLVTPAAVAKLLTLRVTQGPVLAGGAEVTRQVLASEIPTAGPAAPGGRGWATFGEAAAGPSGADAALATIGFAIASPVLLLTGGDRRISLALDWSKASALELWSRLGGVSEVTGRGPFDVLRELLAASLAVQVSTEGGWWKVGAVEASVSLLGVALQILLPSSAPPVVAHGPSEASEGRTGADPDPTAPTLKVELDQAPISIAGLAGAVEIYPLSVLGALELADWRLATKVDGLPDLSLGNTFGPVDPSQPFPVFGAPPVVGSFLDIVQPEIFTKAVTRLSVAITWFDLPPNERGFGGWYADWSIGMDGKKHADLFNNTRFEVDIRVVNPGRWDIADGADLAKPADRGVSRRLFRTEDAACAGTSDDERLCASTAFGDLPLRARPPSGHRAADGAIRVRLTKPDVGFGDALYAKNILNAVLSDLPKPTVDPRPPAVGRGEAPAPEAPVTEAPVTEAPVTAASKPEAPVTEALKPEAPGSKDPRTDPKIEISYPNPPWLPQATGVSLDYEAASARGDGETGGRLYHLLPFGRWAPVPAAADAPLLPRFPAGSLYIGLSGLAPPQPLTLLFQATASEGSDGSERAPPVSWSCLDRRGWTALRPADILADGTGGLQNSGIVALRIPELEPTGTVLDPDLRWLRATVERGASLFPLTRSVTPHALLATWRDNGSVAHLGAPLPPGSVAGALEGLPAIAEVAQPMPSFGGRPPETGRGLRRWLGERLRHKGRGVLAWDYERLVLEAFPTVWKVKALPARDRAGPAPGRVLVVVVPGPDGAEATDPTAPMASVDLLGLVGASLRDRVGPFVRLDVANPVYVRVTVTALVQFSEAEDPGACMARLEDELVRRLSPWPDGVARAAEDGDYASEDEISEYIQTRPYVDAVLSLGFAYAPDPEGLDWYFLTSARQHRITAAGADPMGEARSPGPASAGLDPAD